MIDKKTGNTNKFTNFDMEINKSQSHKDSIKPLIIILGLIIITIVILLTFDRFKPGELFNLIMHPNSENVVGNLLANAGGEIILGLLGIVMTVVAIIVELAANRYTARVSDLFVRDKVNLSFLILLTFTSINLIFILYFGRNNKIPYLLINFTALSMVVCIITLVPYFIYVFKFLEPNSIISKIEKDILVNAKNGQNDFKGNNKSKMNLYQARVVRGVNQLTDIILNSLQKNDNVLATDCIKSLTTFLIDYINLKHQGKFDSRWFYPCDYVRYNNADFVTLMDDSFLLIVEEGTWVEHKLFRQLKIAFEESLNKARDISSFISQCFYQVGITTIKNNDIMMVKLIIKFFNTLLRTAINASDVRSCFNLFFQYRLFAEGLISAELEKLLLDIANYFKYYGILANETKKLSFLLETVAHDLCELNKKAFLKGLDKKGELIDIILKIDNPLEGGKESASLRGVRKSQIILASFYMSFDTEEVENLARKIFYDILIEVNKKDGYERIYSIIKELKYLKADFWEITDRGLNMDYVPINQKKYLQKFMEWVTKRQILLYCYNDVSKDTICSVTKQAVIDQFVNIISRLPDEVPIELCEFEAVFGKENMDTKESFYNHILNQLEYLKEDENLKMEIEKQIDFINVPVDNRLLSSFKRVVTDLKNNLRTKIK